MHIAEHYGVGWLKKDDKPHTITRSGVICMMQTYLKENQGSRLICRLCGREFASGLGMLLHLEGCGEEAKRFKCKYCSRSYTRLSLITHLRSCGHRYQISSSSANVELKTERKIRTKSNLDQSQIKKSSTKAPFNLRLLLIRKREDLDSQVVVQQQDQKDGQLQCGLCSERIIKGDWRDHLSTHYGVGWPSGQEPRNLTRHSIIGQMNSYLKKNPGKRLTCRLCNRQLSSGLGMLLHLEGCGMKKCRMKCKYCAGSFTRLTMLQHIRICERQYEKELQLDMEEQTDIDDSGVEGEGEGSVELSKFKWKRTKSIHNSTKWTKSLYTRYQLLNDKVVSKWTQFTQANYAKEPLYADCLPSYVKLSWTEAYELLNSSRQTKSMRFAYDKVRDECDWRELRPLEAINTKNEYITYFGAPVRQLEWVPLPPNVHEQYLLCSLRSKMHGYTRKMDANAEDKALMVLLKCTLDTETRATDVWPLQMKLHYGIRVQKGPVFSFAFMPSGGYMESSNRLGLLAIATASSEIHIYALPLQLTTEETIQAGQDSIIELNSLMTLSLDVKSSVQDQCTKICWSEAHGHNFLVSGYASGNVAFWDIGDVEGINCFKRHNHNSFVPLHYFYFGERNIQYFTRVVVLSPCGILFNNKTIDYVLDSARDMHFNCQENMLIVVTENGDLAFINPRELNMDPRAHKLTHNVRAVSYTELAKLNVDSSVENIVAISGDDFQRDYGVIIKPLTAIPKAKKDDYLNHKRRPSSFELMTMTRFNSVRCNLNSPARSWVAVGAEHGMLRIVNFCRNDYFT
ncbi:uncharacterized protein Dwil_GK17358 [Drosophila willistoni]|uniref:C2H2-type domain-containing protein n=1 Tax=Drosophila willistoni TaxID=7260 RepID=B4ML35_DROWI|nr:uncharacterized protein Dwil_GK17358 [Drosophila willistoni]